MFEWLLMKDLTTLEALVIGLTIGFTLKMVYEYGYAKGRLL